MAQRAHAEDNEQAETDALAQPSAYRWVVLFGVWLVYGAFGLTAVSLAPLVSAITRDLGISHASMGLVFGTWQLVYIVAAVPCGALLDRIGPGRGMFLGAAAIAASGFLRSVSVDLVTLCLAVALFGVFGAIVSTGAPKVVSTWFRGSERGLAMGIYITGPAIGSITALSLTNSILMPAFGGDWRLVLRLWAAVALAAGLTWLAIAAAPEMRQRDRREAGHLSGSHWGAVGELLQLPSVRLMLMMSVAIFMFNHGLNNWLPEILRSRGMTAAEAGYWAKVPTLVGIIGSLTIPRLATPQRRYGLLIGLCIAAGTASLLLRADQGPLLLAGLLMQGIARSSLMTVMMLTLVETPGIGERRAGMASGLFFSAAEIGGASGPVALGLLHDATGGFGAGLMLLTMLAGLTLTGTLMLRAGARRGEA